MKKKVNPERFLGNKSSPCVFNEPVYIKKKLGSTHYTLSDFFAILDFFSQFFMVESTGNKLGTTHIRSFEFYKTIHLAFVLFG